MKLYVTPELDYIKWRQDVIMASSTSLYDEQEGDIVTPEQDFWR